MGSSFQLTSWRKNREVKARDEERPSLIQASNVQLLWLGWTLQNEVDKNKSKITTKAKYSRSDTFYRAVIIHADDITESAILEDGGGSNCPNLQEYFFHCTNKIRFLGKQVRFGSSAGMECNITHATLQLSLLL